MIPRDALISRLLDNGLTQNFTYNPWGTQGGRLQSLTTAKPDGLGGIVSLQNLSYVYDAAGNVKQITNPLASETNTYGYDPLDRLTSWNLNGTTENYTYDADGNLDIKAGMDLNYNDATHEHAVTHIGGVQKYWHDANGNQTKRIVGADTYDLAYDAENRMVEVKKNNTVMATFVYDGDGRRVESTINGTTTTFVGSHYEVTGGSVTKYYFAGASRIAMRKDGNLTYLLSDHLGSTSITTDANGNSIFEQRYKPWGETRYTTLNATASTKYQFTGQYSHETDFGLLFYNARWVDPQLGRFVQADTIVPGGVQGLDRYAYVNNSPVVYVDPSGHDPVCGFSYSDPECETTSNKQMIEPPNKKMAGEVLHNLAGGDETMYEIWLTLYLTQAGHDLALYIYEHDVSMKFGGETGSYTECASYGCTIYLSKKYMPSVSDTTTLIDINRAAAELGHEAYHATVWREAPASGDFLKDLLRELVGLGASEVSDSQWEEAMASFVQSEIYFELTGMSDVNFESLYVTDPKILKGWTEKNNGPYRRYPLYPTNPK